MIPSYVYILPGKFIVMRESSPQFTVQKDHKKQVLHDNKKKATFTITMKQLVIVKKWLTFISSMYLHSPFTSAHSESLNSDILFGTMTILRSVLSCC